MTASSVLKWPGGKTYLAPKIVALMPPHLHYVEPYFGGGAVLFAKREPQWLVSEVVNDIDEELTNFWRVLQDDGTFARMQRFLEVQPFSEPDWRRAAEPVLETVARAVNFFIRIRQSQTGQGRSFAPLSRKRTRGGMNEQASAWLSAIKGLPEACQRLKRVVILNRPALQVIQQEDGEKTTLFYLDPPYLHDTRQSKNLYRHEMTVADHRDLLDLLRGAKSRVMLSGYAKDADGEPNFLYTDRLKDWNRHDFEIPNQMGSGKKKRAMVESVWCNY